MNFLLSDSFKKLHNFCHGREISNFFVETSDCSFFLLRIFLIYQSGNELFFLTYRNTDTCENETPAFLSFLRLFSSVKNVTSCTSEGKTLRDVVEQGCIELKVNPARRMRSTLRRGGSRGSSRQRV